MPKVVTKSKGGKKAVKEFPYGPAGEAAAEKMANKSGGKVVMPKGFRKGSGKKT